MIHAAFRFRSLHIYVVINIVLLKAHDIIGVSLSVAFHMRRSKITIASSKLVFANPFVIAFSSGHLRVVGGLRLVEYADVLVLTERLFLGV